MRNYAKVTAEHTTCTWFFSFLFFILGSDVLGNLNAEFKKLLEIQPIAIVSVVETKSTLVQPWGIEFKFVEPSSTGSNVT